MKHWISALAFSALATAVTAPAALAQGAAASPSVTVNYTSSPIRLDGRIEEKFWADATPIQLVTFDGKPIQNGAVARMAWDTSNFYVGAEMPDTRVVGGRLGHDGPLWEKDDVLEVFLWPSESLPYYYQFVVNPRPTVYEAFCVARPTHDGADVIVTDWNPNIRVQTRVKPLMYRPDHVGEADPNGFWSVEMAIPIASLSSRGSAPLQAGEKWRVQIVRFNRPDPAPGTLDASAFSPYDQVDAPYLLDRFGTITFAGAPAVPVAPLVPGTGATARPEGVTTAPTAPAVAPPPAVTPPPTPEPVTPAPTTPANPETPAPTTPTTPANPESPEPATPANPEPATPAAPAEKTVTLNVTGYALKDAVALLFQGTGLDFLVLPAVASNPVTAEIQDKPLEEALATLVDKGGAKFHKDSATGVYVIEPKDTAESPSAPPR